LGHLGKSSVAIGTVLVASSVQATPLYTVTLLGNLGMSASGAATSKAYGINASGYIVGVADKYSNGVNLGSRAVRWASGATAAAELGNLGTEPGGFSSNYAYAINAGGDAAGFAYKYVGGSNVGSRAVVWAAGDILPTELGNLGTDASGFSTGAVYALNAHGDAAGFADGFVGTSWRGQHAVRWSAGQLAATELGNLGTDSAGFFNSKVNALDAAGDAGGSANKFSSTHASLGSRAVVWPAGQITALELAGLGVNSTGKTVSGVNAGNAAGDFAGYATKFSGDADLGFRAVWWRAGQTSAIELGNLGTDASGVTSSAVYAMNDAGDAVGASNRYSGNATLGLHATLWRTGQTAAIDLNDLIPPDSGWVLERAQAILDDATIVGSGQFDPDGTGPALAQTRAFRLTQVPEPASLTSLILSLVACARRRPRRSSLDARVVMDHRRHCPRGSR
jgi:hypothetical protein